MKLLTITNEKQGTRANDFCFGNEGEIAKFGSVCDRATVDDKCGCKRAMVGLSTSKASTTVKVTDVDITKQHLVDALAFSYVTNWQMPVLDAKQLAASEAANLIKYASIFEDSAVVEIRGNKLATR